MKKLHARELSRNQPRLCFNVILQHDWPIEQFLLHIRIFFGGKTKGPCFDFFIHWLIKQIMNTYRNDFYEFKCNLKELTTKSAWVPRSAVFGMRMPGGWLHRSCDSLARSVFPSCWVLSPIFFVFLGVFSSLRAVRHRCRRFRELFLCFFFPSVSSKVGSTCLATR